MPTYAVLQNPGHNRVYFNAARSLSMHELDITMDVKNIREKEWGNVPYIIFDTEKPLEESEITILSRLSFTYAVFLLENTLIPIDKDPRYFLSDDISMMLKYTGKTNELFTRLMVNIAVSYLNAVKDEIKILDPVCGKGTTLFESLLMGHHAYGIEIDEKIAYEAFIFYKKYLETAKIKHSSHQEKISGLNNENKKFTSQRFQVNIKNQMAFEIIAGDSLFANQYYKKNNFHAIIGDLPYGVQHGSGKKSKNITRNAMAMLMESLPQWIKVLKQGGVIVLAWNLFLIPREEMDALFVSHGLHIPEETRNAFAHRVDQAINRDFIVGVKP